MKRRDEKQESTSGIIGLGEYIVEWRKGQSREGIVAGAWTTDPVIVAFLLNPNDPATFRRFLLTSSIPIVSALFFFLLLFYPPVTNNEDVRASFGLPLFPRMRILSFRLKSWEGNMGTKEYGGECETSLQGRVPPTKSGLILEKKWNFFFEARFVKGYFFFLVWGCFGDEIKFR